MSIPGFTADASLHGMNRYDQRARISATSREEVVPALPSCDTCLKCYADLEHCSIGTLRACSHGCYTPRDL